MRTSVLIIGLMIGLCSYGQGDSWTIVTKNLPLSETFEAGTKITVVVNYDAYSQISYFNDSGTPAKVIHYESVEGVSLPEDKIGPVRFRTKQLSPGEKSQQTFNWKNGQEVSIEVHEGTLHIGIGPEKKTH